MYQIATLDVSRETMEALKAYEALILKWNSTINLISKGGINDVWERHIVDSAQIYLHRPDDASNWLDLGSGGGLPGLVVAILAKQLAPDQMTTLVESDQRKSVFLRTVIRELSLNAKVIAQRVEAIPDQKADIISARALASVNDLFEMSERHIAPNGCLLFLKGRRAEEELADAANSWKFDVVRHPSLTDNESTILEIRELRLA